MDLKYLYATLKEAFQNANDCHIYRAMGSIETRLGEKRTAEVESAMAFLYQHHNGEWIGFVGMSLGDMDWADVVTKYVRTVHCDGIVNASVALDMANEEFNKF